MLSLVGVDESPKHVQPVALRRSRLCALEELDLLERGFVIALRADRSYPSRHAEPLYIDPVVIPVRADLLDPHDALLKINGDDQPIVVTLDAEHDQQHIELVGVVGALRRAPLGFDLSERRAVILCARIGRMSIMLSSKPRNDDCVDAVILCVGTNDRTKRFGSQPGLPTNPRWRCPDVKPWLQMP